VGSVILTTPVVFLIVLAFMLLLLRALGAMKLRVVTPAGSGKGKAYACGEDMQENRVQPDYRQFFPFAFFFTIMHVLALVVATVPGSPTSATGIAVGYCVCLVIGLFVLFRK
jgi:NADH:ubiquinone oxidoreductase subunit 3 (subunit A)